MVGREGTNPSKDVSFLLSGGTLEECGVIETSINLVPTLRTISHELLAKQLREVCDNTMEVTQP